jgi:hypothetical protein
MPYNYIRMKRFCLVLVLLAASSLFAAYPDEYPGYLRMLGFSKKEIRDLRDGGIVIHTHKEVRPGERGISAARVFDVPGYFIRDYYSYIENFRNLQNFQIVGKFSEPATLQDLVPLTFDALELKELAACKVKCSLNLTQEEVNGIQDGIDLQEYYRNILLDRLSEYKTQANHSKNYLQDFSYLPAYFPHVLQYLTKYPQTRDKNIPEFFFWIKEKIGGKNIIQLRHVYSQRVVDDFVLVNNLVYSNQSLMASASVVHLINYVDRGYPRTLLVYYGRNYVDPETGTASRQDKRIFTALEVAGKELEKRYLSSYYPDFPYGLLPTDQR